MLACEELLEVFDIEGDPGALGFDLFAEAAVLGL